MRGLHIIIGGLLFILFVACQPSEEESDNRLLAKVRNKQLFLSEMDGMFPQNATKEDSISVINAYVSRWIREALLLSEAERNIPNDLNIDRLVRDYRASLIKHNYEKILVEEFLDSTITSEELNGFYEKNKEQYQLQTPIIRCFFLKVPLPLTEEEKLGKLWKQVGDQGVNNDLIAYGKKHNADYLIRGGEWYKVEEIATRLPKGSITTENIEDKREFTQKDESYQYYLKVLEYKNIQDIAPLSYIEDQARKVILRKRKVELLERKKEEMYEIGMRKKNIKVFTD